MTARRIIRDPAILSGRWRLEGTMTPIANVRNDFYLGHDGPVETYRFAGLTADDGNPTGRRIWPRRPAWIAWFEQTSH